MRRTATQPQPLIMLFETEEEKREKSQRERERKLGPLKAQVLRFCQKNPERVLCQARDSSIVAKLPSDWLFSIVYDCSPGVLGRIERRFPPPFDWLPITEPLWKTHCSRLFLVFYKTHP